MIDQEQKRHERERKKAETLAKKRAQKTGRGKKRPIPESSDEEKQEPILYNMTIDLMMKLT